MAALIENPILNSPFREPTRHFKFDEDGITNEIVSGRRPSSHFVPIPRAKKKGKQLQFETEWTKDRIESNPVVDRIRQRVGAWRQGGVRLQPDLLNLIVEVTGEARKDKAAKVTTARTLWVPAVNNHGGFGRWAFVEVTDPWDAQRTIRAALAPAPV
jgi:hypothetical protein